MRLLLRQQVEEVFNEFGKDVTPKPLMTLQPTVLTDKLWAEPGAQSIQGSDLEHSVPIYSRTGFSVTSTAGSLTPETIDLGPDLDIDEQDSRKSRSFRSSSVNLDTTPTPKLQVIAVYAPIISPTTEPELENPIPVHITESCNQVLLSMRGNNLNMAFETINQVLSRNTHYEELLSFKKGSDNYQPNMSQTLFSLEKNKESQASILSTQSYAIQVNSWDIADSFGGKVKPDQYQPWKVVPHGGKDTKTTNPTTTVVLLSEIFSAEEPSAPLSSLPSPSASRRQSNSGGGAISRKGSMSIGGLSRRPSASGGQISKRPSWSVASRRVSTSGGTQGLDEYLRGASPESLGTALGSAIDSQVGASEIVKPVELQPDLSKLTGLFKALEMVERAIVLNTYHDMLLEFCDFRAREIIPEPPPPAELDKDGKPVVKKPPTPPPPSPPLKEEPEQELGPKVILPTIEPSTQSVHGLWNFECDVTEGRNVSCMAWNKANKHLLAVGYGQFEFGIQKRGMIAFWSLKNPRYPHAMITTKSGVLTLDFAIASPSLLAAGFYSGNVAIYDIRNPKEGPVIQSGFETGKHNDPIWKVQWVDHSSEHGESLVSVSTDGRVSQWSIKKDLEYVNLMRLKKVPGQNKGAQPQPFISRRSAGLCFEFSPKHPSVYLVGTEEGPIYKCDRSYSEQYMQMYMGHNGPVYQVRWSPFMSNLFLSCSSDWTVRLWNEEQANALLVFQTVNMGIADVQWSLANACVFALASTNGHLEVWDMQISVMKPIVVYYIENCVFSCLLFALETPILLLGGNTGSINVLRMEGFERNEDENVEIKKLKDALVANVTRHGGT
ncbi:unnamed protein product [Sphagnum balticum]